VAEDRLDPILEHVDSEKRDFLKTVLTGTAFVAPIVASFSMEGLTPNEAFAQSTNTSFVNPGGGVIVLP
jgi:hypothetical protein